MPGKLAFLRSHVGRCVWRLVGCRKRRVEADGFEPLSGRDRRLKLSPRRTQLYAERADVMKAASGADRLAQAARAEYATNYEAGLEAGEVQLITSALTPTDETEQEKAFHDGIEAGKLAVKLTADKPEGHFWLGANYGGNAELSTLAGLPRSRTSSARWRQC